MPLFLVYSEPFKGPFTYLVCLLYPWGKFLVAWLPFAFDYSFPLSVGLLGSSSLSTLLKPISNCLPATLTSPLLTLTGKQCPPL